MSEDHILTLKQIANRLGSSEKTVRRRFKAGDLPGAFKMPGRSSPIKMPESAIEKLKRGDR